MKTLAVTLAACACSLALYAEEPFIVGPRSLATGGTGVATADDYTAAYYNPAIFGFFGRSDTEGGPRADNNGLSRRGFFGLNIVDVQVGLRQYGEIGDYLTTLADEMDTIDALGANGVNTPEDVAALIRISTALTGIDNPGNALGVDGNSGFGIRLGHLGLGVRGWGQISAVVNDLDLTNVGLGAGGGGNFSQDIENTGAPRAAVNLLAGLNPGISVAAQEILEFQAQQAGVTSAEAAELVTLINASFAQYGITDIADNLTSVTFSGIGVMEIPITYGHAFSDQFSVGVNLKGMIGRVYGTTILVLDEENNDFTAIEDNFKETFTFGVDVGALYRLPRLNLGVDIRNLNAPKFAGPAGFSDVTLDPQITIGAGFFPLKTLGLSMDIDVLRTDSLVQGYQAQRLMFGLEWDVWRFLALRVGTYSNLAEDEIGRVVTAGIGLNFWAVRLDLAGAISLKTVEVDGSDVPREARVAFRLASEW